MSASLATADRPGRPQWIVSPWWDLSYVVITPFLIVPVMLVVTRQWLSPEQVSLAVISFASLGHHLPGFMRAYGDRDLFSRYRWRFLLVPPLVFAMALLFSPPRVVADAFDLPWRHLHGLELVLLIWGTWHGLMQTYGFMRIYDVRRGVFDRRSARLDHALCLLVFITGVVFSDARVFGIAKAMGESGLPILRPDLLLRLRMLLVAAGGLILFLYGHNLVRESRNGQTIGWVKLLLIATTGWFYWYTGSLSVNVLVGIAMFEIYHAVQYDAIVWMYNKRLWQRAGNRFGPLGFLFRDRWTMLGVYLAAIAAYSSIRFFTVDANAYIFTSGQYDGYQWLTALFVASSFLHFYYDGFIWKVSEKKTQENLVEQADADAPALLTVSSLTHVAKWAVLISIIITLVASERGRLREAPQANLRRLAALSVLTPDLPECHALLCRDALARGDAARAIAHAEQGIHLRSRSHTAHADLGLAYLLANRWTDARQQFEQAIAIAPDQWAHHCDLGTVLLKLGDSPRAERELELAVQLGSDTVEPFEQLADFYLRENRTDDALALFESIAKKFPESQSGELGKIQVLNRLGKHREAVKLASFLAAGNPDDWRVLLALGASFNAAGQPRLALAPLKHALTLNPTQGELHYQLGLAQFQLGKSLLAVHSLRTALRYDTQHFSAQLQLANTFYVLGEWDDALQAYQKALQLRPGDPTASANYGGLFAQLGMHDEAVRVYQRALDNHPDNGQLTYNLGVALWQLGRRDQAVAMLTRAQQLGIQLPPAVEAEVNQATQ